MIRTLSTAVALLALFAACGNDGEVAAKQTQTSILISGPEEEPREPVAVRSFSIESDTVRRGQPAKARVQLEAPRPQQQVSVNWYGPDGWLVAYETRVASEARLEFDVPAQSFERAGQYRAVVRAGRTPLAEDVVTVTD